MGLTYNWNTQTTSQTDADSPTDTTLMEGIRQNLIYLLEVGTYGGVIDVRNDSADTFVTTVDKIVQFDAEAVDSNGEFNIGTHRWTPGVEGLYACHVFLEWGSATALGVFDGFFKKNGTIHPNANANMQHRAVNNALSQFHHLFGLIDVNGTTDYIEVWASQSQGGNRILNADSSRWIGYRVGINDAL